MLRKRDAILTLLKSGTDTSQIRSLGHSANGFLFPIVAWSQCPETSRRGQWGCKLYPRDAGDSLCVR
jgi:hypothetical protein